MAAGVDFLTRPVVGVRLVATYNFCTSTRRRARARPGVIEPRDPPRSQNYRKTLTAPTSRKALHLRCGAKTRTGAPCQRKTFANGRCRNHGGMSSGPKSPPAANAFRRLKRNGGRGGEQPEAPLHPSLLAVKAE